ncbi:hypothetical protein [Litorisediminicola beolgyonensis]|uniref:Lipoprotein n=1 Tax=Litorisediminicola beolgyonensis TaxID=1173614 RepID=A0ABW3ZH98_9RHOB
MRTILMVVALFVPFGLAGCAGTAPTTYPISGESCSPADPVQDLDATDCVQPV